ncbi:MAG: exosortase-associated EpsI family protein [Planctomycetaceae bacterium]|nr:exosortase-associated EpsI family protein [Planctomycetaceae bacterium]
MKSTHLLTIAATLLILSGGIAQGLLTHRWLPNAAVFEAVSAIQSLPNNVSDWTSTDIELPEREQQIGGIAGYVQRTYTDRLTGAAVNVLLVTGDSGPISLHPPTACFTGRGFQVVGQPSILALSSQPAAADDASVAPYLSHVFHQADFANSAVEDVVLTRVYWGWSTDGQWQAPTNPRIEFAREPVLFKIYFSETWVPTGDTQQDAGAAQRLMKELLPLIHSRLAQRSNDSNAKVSHE